MLPQNTTNNVTFKSVSFQDADFQIQEDALLSWRKSRTALSNAVKAQERATHFNTLMADSLMPHWSLGLSKVPQFLILDRESKASFVEQYRAHAQGLLDIVQRSLTRRASAEMRVGNTFKAAVIEIYGPDNVTGSNAAVALLDRLVQRDLTNTRSILSNRTAVLRASPISDLQISQGLGLDGSTGVYNAPQNAVATRPRSRSNSPRRGAARGRGNARGGNARGGNARGNPRGRGNSRGGRGRGARRGSGNRRYDRSYSPEPNNQFNLSQNERAVIEALRRGR